VVVVYNKRLYGIANGAFFAGHFQVSERFVANNTSVPTPAVVASIPRTANAAPAIEPGFCLAVRWEMLCVRDLYYFAACAKLGRG
jgi:hypothetical protein